MILLKKDFEYRPFGYYAEEGMEQAKRLCSLLPHLMGGFSSDNGYRISRSIRSRPAASTYLGRTFGSGGNQRTFTVSTWLKLCSTDPGNVTMLLEATIDANNRLVWQIAGSSISMTDVTSGSGLQYAAAANSFRDYSAWQHLVLKVDTTQATPADRIRMYQNGVELALTGTSYPAQNTQVKFNNPSTLHTIGRSGASSPTYSNAYFAEFNFVDGLALAPTFFGKLDVNGAWQPVKYAGSYGTTGFYLNFADNSAVTATALGKDSSGLGNNWTPFNFSVSAGVSNDSLVDTPTNYGSDTGAGGEVRGNYATINPLATPLSMTLGDGNLSVSGSGITNHCAVSTFGMRSGKWYWEATNTGTLGIAFGITTKEGAPATYIGGDATSWSYAGGDGNKYTNGSGSAYGAAWSATGTVVGIAFDADNGKLYFRLNGTWQNSGDPVAGTGAAFTGLTNGPYFAGVSSGNTLAATMNFGQRPFANAAPSGFKALCTQNLSNPVIKKPSQYFDAVLYAGSAGTVTKSGLAQPDVLWFKDRTSAQHHKLVDSVRGAAIAFSPSNAVPAETTDSKVTINSDGFSLATGSRNYSDSNADGYVAWLWKKGATPGVDVVTYTGTGALRNVAHSLGVVPGFVIVVRRGGGTSHRVWHQKLSASSGKELYLDLPNVESTSAQGFASAPTSTNVVLGTDAQVNALGESYVMYVFADVPGFSKFGGYVGNGNVDGTFVWCGFKPRLIVVKDTTASADWIVHDSVRDPYNYADNELQWSNSLAEYSAGAAGAGQRLDILSNGFKLRSTNNGSNSAGDKYIFIAFAETPFNYARAR